MLNAPPQWAGRCKKPCPRQRAPICRTARKPVARPPRRRLIEGGDGAILVLRWT